MSDHPIAPGFRPRQADLSIRKRLPPGQYITQEFPVLSAGPTPHIDLDSWDLTFRLDRVQLSRWSWSELEALPQTQWTTDIHCVTKWTNFDSRWQGVTFDDLMASAGLTDPPAPFVMAECEGGYSTNLPVEDLLGGKGMIATGYEGLPILPAHGGPVRLLVPHLYFWKSAKWLTGLRFMSTDERGFWEARGYHNHGDPWKEQRYDGD